MKKPTNMMKRIIRQLKIFFACLAMLGVAFAFGTFMPNNFTIDRISHQAEELAKVDHQVWVEKLALEEPAFEYNTNVQFVAAVHKCVDYLNVKLTPSNRVPLELVTAQAVLETGWGTSRFAEEANNLFGIKTWNKDEGVLPQGYSENTPWRIRTFKTKCDSVKEYIRLLNNHTAYQSFRDMRIIQLGEGKMDSVKLAFTMTKFSTTDDYPKLVKRIILKIRNMDLPVLDVVAMDTKSAINIDIKLKPEVILPKEKPDELKE